MRAWIGRPSDEGKEIVGNEPSLEDKIQELELAVQFLYYWIIRQDERLRNIVAKIGPLERESEHNNQAFDFKWKALGFGTASLDNPEHKAAVADLIADYTGLPKEWFSKKVVLDAGCGDGRFSYGFCQLGAKVTSVDISPFGVEKTRKWCAGFPNHTAMVWDVLKPWPQQEVFDLVFSFGVLHCTGDTRLAIQNLAGALKSGGHFLLMVYGYPRWGQPGHFAYMVRKERIRQAIRHMDMEEAKAYITQRFDDLAVRGWFDATTPMAEDHYTFEQVAQIMKAAGLRQIKCIHPEKRNIIAVGVKHA